MMILVLMSILLLFIAGILFLISLFQSIRKKSVEPSRRISIILFVFGLLLFCLASGNGRIKDTCLMMSLLLIGIGIVLFLYSVILKIRRKEMKKSISLITILSLSIGFLLMLVSSSMRISDLLLFAMLILWIGMAFLIVRNLYVQIFRHKKGNWIGVLVCFVCSIGFYVLSNYLVKLQWENTSHEQQLAPIVIQTDVDFEIKDGDSPIEIITSTGFNNSLSYHTVYDAKDIPLLGIQTRVTEQMCIDAIQKNGNIEHRFKEYFCDFVHRIAEKYPNATLDILYNNLKGLKVVELPPSQYVFKSYSTSSSGCYRNDENTIYIPEGTQYKEGEWGFQVLLHEFCHVLRTSWFEQDSISCRLVFNQSMDTDLLMESLNSEFSCSLLHYYEKDIAYQIPSNYLRIMLECMDNYEMSDYINHSDAYFLRKLDEATGYTNYASVIWKLITLQRMDWNDDKIDLPSEKYNPIYDYLCEMYYKKYLHEGMSEDEKQKVADELVEKAFYDAPEGYNINPKRFYENLE